jgi:AraC family transcriptional regulator of adaptative response/methylated-DNA-[protein]-cysteine methyltransferase
MESPNKWWKAVLDRDREFDGRFVYAVRSTGIYCRPTCPSRRPSRGQVLFFPGSEPAEQAGFRACRRCHPRDQMRIQSNLVREVCRYIEANSVEAVHLSTLSSQFRVSASHLRRVFLAELGISPAQYARAYRVKAVKKALRNGSDVTSAIYEAGFGSNSRLYEISDSKLGMTPATYGKGARHERIRYTTAACSLGRILVAGTHRGICSIALADSDRELISSLRSEYPHARITRDKVGLRQTLALLLAHLNGSEPCPDFPLDIRATAFQQRVWDELRRIPYGSTSSYSDVARAVGKPKAARAVARACATNPAALVIPCHRVIGKSGHAAGYRWGKTRKLQLLANEKARNRD